MGFIRVTGSDGVGFYVNTDKIIVVSPDTDTKMKTPTLITLTEYEEALSVMESVDEVISKICTVQGRKKCK